MHEIQEIDRDEASIEEERKTKLPKSGTAEFMAIPRDKLQHLGTKLIPRAERETERQ
jgi:hypothetical protein